MGGSPDQAPRHDARQVSRSNLIPQLEYLFPDSFARVQLHSPDIELMDVVENIFRLANALLETDTARRTDIFRRYKIEPLCLHWAACTDGHQEEINIPAAKLWRKLDREMLQVNAELKKEAMDFLVA
jgi:hypothetical protein